MLEEAIASEVAAGYPEGHKLEWVFCVAVLQAAILDLLLECFQGAAVVVRVGDGLERRVRKVQKEGAVTDKISDLVAQNC